MKNKIIAVGMCLASTINASPKSGDIMGRDLIVPVYGYLGHVGMATGDSIGNFTGIVIEALNENPVIQINSIGNFQKRSKYWGTRYGAIPYQDPRLKLALIEINHQRWWCPSYTYTVEFVPGYGNVKTGQVGKCGTWRCDSLIEYHFAQQGVPRFLSGDLWPQATFNKFPYYGGNDFISKYTQLNDTVTKPLEIMDAEELNNMDFHNVQHVVDIPFSQQYDAHYQAEWRMATETKVNDLVRGMLIDRLSMQKGDDKINKFIEMYKNERSSEVKDKLLQGLMIHYQNFEESLTTEDREKLKEFYTDLMNRSGVSSMTVRGYIDFNEAEELENKVELINSKTTGMEKHMLLGLRHNLMLKSEKLEMIYLPKIMASVKADKSMDLNDMFFGLMALGYPHLKSSIARNYVKDYVNDYKSNINMFGENNQLASLSKDSFDKLVAVI